MNELIKRVRENPKTTWLGVVCVGLYGGGKAMSANGVVPWGSIVIGLARHATLIGLMLARDDKPKPPEGQ